MLKEELSRLKERESQTLQQLWQAEEQGRRAVNEAREEEEERRRQAVNELEADLRAQLESALAEVEQGAEIISNLMRESEEQARKLGEMRGALEASKRSKDRAQMQQEQQLKTHASRMQSDFDKKQRALRHELQLETKTAREQLAKARDEWAQERDTMQSQLQDDKQVLLH